MRILKIKLKKIVAFIMAAVMLGGVFCIPHLTAKAVEQPLEQANCDVYDGGYDIDIDNGNIVKVLDNGNIVFIAEYENGERISKQGQNTCYFTYEDGILVKEVRDDKVIQYFSEYDESNHKYRYVGFKIDNQSYIYIWDAHQITGITDESGTEIVRYIYNGLQVIDVMEYNGRQWISNDEEVFLGNYNKIRGYGTYLDDETGWYYSNGVYDDVKVNKIVGMKENDIYLSETNPFSVIPEDGIMPLTYEDDDIAAELWADELLENATFNAEKDENYYSQSGTATVEIVARTIYGENCARTQDQNAIAWVILNRYHSNKFPSSIRGIITAKLQFTGKNNDVAIQQQNPRETLWRNAVYLACLILTNDSEACWDSVSPKPKGITNQLYFRSADSLGKTSGVFEKNGALYVRYDSNDTAITNACIAGKGTATTVSGLKKLCTEGEKKYNVYFYHD
ncbi:MAG: cell wall hydrolase [Butyrivibrio sp.]|nr:cell wall hydrolase [Muribaculum sp.]MCM1551301.1 cell wall hydrolase [Butyrivibrio sp.]